METKASYLIVGGFVLALIVGLFLFVIWLTGTRTSQAYTEFRTYFKGSVTGLQEGGVVRYRGIPVGTVRRMNIDPDNSEQVEVTMDVQSGTPVKEDTEASLESAGLTGVAYVQLSGGSQGSPLLKPKQGKKIAIIPSRPSELEQVFRSAPKVLERAGALAERATLAFSDRNLQSFSDSLANISTITAAIAAKGDEIQTAIDDAVATAHDLRATAASLDVMARTMTADADAAFGSVQRLADNANDRTTEIAGELRRAAGSFNRLSNELDTIIAENRRPISDFSSQGLYELTQFLTDARVMVQSVTRLTNKIEADPARFFFGNQQQGVPAR